ncbi:hypothetical protein JCM10908_006716 [Rhodotorula pacifica]|uniref:alpha/beta fold hydrolase n=1 Tax=Rhodotorula pacifica TaxID=1495444 RepID=UPI0031772C6E
MATPAAPPSQFVDSPISSPTPASDSTSATATHTEQPLPETIFDPDTLVKRGWCTVANDKKRAASPHKLYYELHGEDKPTSKRLVFTMGLNNSSFAWHEQVAYFARQKDYAVLVFDNRGVGWSDSPGWSYTTREMALDLVELLDYLGWTEERSLNVIGVSMGGMIVQQLALLIPRRIRTLLLTSTRSGSKSDLPSYQTLNMFVRLTSGTVRTPEKQIRLVVDTLYPQAYLEEIVQGEGEEWDGKTQRERIETSYLHRYKIGRRQSFAGRVGQLAAAMRHQITPEQAQQISRDIPRIAIIHGTEDKLLHVDRGRDLHAELPGSTLKIVENAGHALPSQNRDLYHDWIREHVEAEP